MTAHREKGDGVQVVLRQWPPASLLGDPSLAPGNRLIVAVLVGIVSQELLDGIIGHQESGDDTLTPTAKDLSEELDLEERDVRYPNQSDSVIVAQILGRYANPGITPSVSPTADVPIETERVSQHNETDRAYVRRMAERNGYVFYTRPVTIWFSKAYWGPELRAGLPQPALSQGIGAAAILRPRGLVGVRDVGLALEGLYVVDAVTDKFSRGVYTQSFCLSREGLVSTVPVVPV